MTDAVKFPDNFVWGAATAAYQVEGAVEAAGRGPSIWDTFCKVPGAILNGDSGDNGAQQYTRYPQDIAMMRRMNLDAYRFSMAWPRIQPTGSGQINKAGLDYYDRLIDALLDADIQPWVTIYHWDLPQPLEAAGGWPARDTAHRFAEYAGVVGDHFGDRVAGWTTLNEPWCSSFLGYWNGEHAPGRKNLAAGVVAAHNLLLAHGLGVQALRAADVRGPVGIVLNTASVLPATDSPADIEAARRMDLGNKLFLDPLYKGAYDDEVLAEIARSAGSTAHIRESDGAIIAAPTDYLGINFYGPEKVTPDPATADVPNWPGRAGIRHVDWDVEKTAMGWAVEPAGLTHLLNRIRSEYGDIPFYITENGAAYDDAVAPDGHVHDAKRTAYIRGHLEAVAAMLDEGIDIRGYFVWSLLDNFEWSFGYDRRFGVVWVDYETYERTVKDSGLWYAEVARTHALPA
ncbi:MAG: beta-galactosidase [Frankiales bacterium]|nr:beta-galactosidase [Frankiales bacterium]